MRGTPRAGQVMAVVLLAAVLAAGCGSAPYETAALRGAAGSGGRPGTAHVPSGPPTISRRQAERLARSMLSAARLPRGAVLQHGPPAAALGQPQGMQAGSPSVQAGRLWKITEPASEVFGFLLRNAPAGMTLGAYSSGGSLAPPVILPCGPRWLVPPAFGTSSSHLRAGPRPMLCAEQAGHGLTTRTASSGAGPGGRTSRVMATVTARFVSYQPRRLPAGAYAAVLALAVAPAGRGASEIHASAQVIWYPPRSAAEQVPAGMHAVTVTASYLNPHPGRVTRTFTSPRLVRRLAAMLDAAHAAPQGFFISCPLIAVTYRLAFARSPAAAPYLTAVVTTCPAVPVAVRGHSQPALTVPPGLDAMLAGLTQVRMFPGAGANGLATGYPG